MLVSEILDKAEAARLFTYRADTGQVVRRVTVAPNAKAGQIVGSVNSDGYLCTRVCGRPVKVHRLAWLLATGAWPKGQIDHLNGDRRDNRLANLRDVSASINARNMKAKSRSGHRGVYPNRGCPKLPWAAQLRVDGVYRHLGGFATKEAASAAVRKAVVLRDGFCREDHQ